MSDNLGLSQPIALFPLSMHTTIDLDDEPMRRRRKVHDVPPNDMLPTKLHVSGYLVVGQRPADC